MTLRNGFYVNSELLKPLRGKCGPYIAVCIVLINLRIFVIKKVDLLWMINYLEPAFSSKYLFLISSDRAFWEFVPSFENNL
jgi:hypothetical protein